MGGLINTWRPLVVLCQQFQDEPRPLVLFGDRRNLGQFKFPPNNITTSATTKKILNPYCTFCCISPQRNPVISGAHAEAWGPFAVARSRALRCQTGT